jgi:putative oxidoreductase
MRSPLLTTNVQPAGVDILLLLFRIICGLLFIQVGWLKIQHPFNWMGPGSAYPGIFQMLAAISEFCGGIALILGFLTRIAAFGIACTMIVATYVVKFTYGAPFVSLKDCNAYFPNVLLLLVALLFIINGPGRFSVDRLLFGIRLKESDM